MIFVLYLGHGIFRPVCVAGLFTFKSVFGRRLKLANRGTPEKKWLTSVAAFVVVQNKFLPLGEKEKISKVRSLRK